jgi:hypothetical protein
MDGGTCPPHGLPFPPPRHTARIAFTLPLQVASAICGAETLELAPRWTTRFARFLGVLRSSSRFMILETLGLRHKLPLLPGHPLTWTLDI